MKRTRKSKRRRCRSHNYLRFESLEQRDLLAVASFYIDFYEDAGGVPGELVTDDTIEAGAGFFVEIRAQEHDPGVSGLGGIFLDIAWDASLLEIVEPFDPRAAVTPNLPVQVRGTLHQDGPTILPFLINHEVRRDIGHIDGLGGAALESLGAGQPIGSDGDDRYVKESLQGYSTTDDHFAWLHFHAEQPGENVFTMRQGRLRITTLPVADLKDAHLRFETKTLTIVEPPSTISAETSHDPVNAVVVESEAPPINPVPRIEVTIPGEQVRFTTTIDSTAGASQLVRPAFPDDGKSIDVSNTGNTLLTISEIHINVPNVTVTSGDRPIVVQPGETKKLGLTYAPTTPNAADVTVQSFDVDNGLVILSDAVNAPIVHVRLSGESTFDADTNYDGRVDLADLISFDRHFGLQRGDDDYSPRIDPNGDGLIDVADLRPFAAHYHLSRDVPFVGPVQLSTRIDAEGEGQANLVLTSNVCAVTVEHRTSGSMPQPRQRAADALVPSTSFIGPIAPSDQATRLVLAASPNTTQAVSNILDDDLLGVLATDVNSLSSQPTL